MSIGDKLLGASAKYVIGPLVNGISKANEYIEEKTGKSLFDRMADMEAKNNKLKEDKPFLWAAKKIGLGALKGIFGASVTKD